MEDSLNPRPVRDSQSEMAEIVLPNDANPLGALLGGRLMHWIDLAGAMAAHRHSRNYVVTASVEGCEGEIAADESARRAPRLGGASHVAPDARRGTRRGERGEERRHRWIASARNQVVHRWPMEDAQMRAAQANDDG